MVVAIWEKDMVVVIFISPSTQPLQLQLNSYSFACTGRWGQCCCCFCWWCGSAVSGSSGGSSAAAASAGGGGGRGQCS